MTCILGTGSNSCLFDGTEVSEEVPALAYILGDEGSGSWFGKKLLSAFLYHQLPAEIEDDFAGQYDLDKLSITKRVYQEPNANVFLASFMTFLGRHRDHALIKEWLDEGFKAFLDVHVACFEGATSMPVHFVGSVAYHFRDALKKACEDRGYSMGNVIQEAHRRPGAVPRQFHSKREVMSQWPAGCLFDMDGVIVDDSAPFHGVEKARRRVEHPIHGRRQPRLEGPQRGGQPGAHLAFGQLASR